MQIEVIVREKIARLANKQDFAVCGNSDYVIKFNFDSEWDAYETKTARFKYNGTYTDVVFNDNECPMPIITNAFRLEIGVYAADLHTTSCAVLPLRKSILCGSETESEVSQEIKNDLDKLLQKKIDNPQTARINEVLTVEEVDSEGKPTKWKTEKPTAEQVQADWNENDETAKSYVKNRPGGYTKIEPTITGKYTGTELNMGEFTLTVGKEYIVKIDDKEYTATCGRSQTGRYEYCYVLGDYSYSSVPFYLRIIDTVNDSDKGQTGDLLAKLSSDITNATITVLENITHQFDIKYIPDIPAEKIFPNPVGAFENIGTISLASATEQTISLSKYDYRIIIGFGKVVASTSPSQLIYNRVYNEPPTGGDLRFSHYTNIAFIAFNMGAGLFSMFLMRYVGSTTTTPERSIGDIFFFPYKTYLSFKDITGNKLPATSISLYGMN